MTKNEIEQYLQQYKVKQLLELANLVGIRVSKYDRKQIIIMTISNFYGFIQLAKDMENRPK